MPGLVYTTCNWHNMHFAHGLWLGVYCFIPTHAVMFEGVHVSRHDPYHCFPTLQVCPSKRYVLNYGPIEVCTQHAWKVLPAVAYVTNSYIKTRNYCVLVYNYDMVPSQNKMKLTKFERVNFWKWQNVLNKMKLQLCHGKLREHLLKSICLIGPMALPFYIISPLPYLGD